MPRFRKPNLTRPANLLCHSALALIVVTLFGPSASGQYRFDSWTSDSGLPQNSVQSILQAGDGYLWFTTSDGLVRFDGVRFTVFNRANTRGISSNRLAALYEDSQGALWVGADDRGLMRYKDGEFKTFTVEDGLPDFWIWAIREDDAGRLLVVTQHGMARLQGEKFVPYVPEGGISSRRYWEQRYGGLSFYDATGLYKFEGGRYRTLTAQEGFSNLSVRSIYEDQYKTLWVVTRDRKLHRLKGGTDTIYSLAALRDALVTAVCEDRAGNIWFAQEGGGVSRLKDGKFATYTAAQGAPGRALLSIYEDREGDIWLGSNGDGLYRIKRQAVTAYAERDGLAYDNVVTVLEDRKGDIWIGTYGRGLDRLRNGAVTHLTAVTGLVGDKITALAEDSAGNIWVGSVGRGVTLLQGERATTYLAGTGLLNNTVSVIYQDRTGSIWLGHTGGLTEYKDGVFYPRSTAGLANVDVRAIVEDDAGRFWFGTFGGISSCQNGQFTNYTEREGLSSNHVRTIYKDEDGTLWIGTYDAGLNRFKDGKFTRYTMSDGLFNNGVFCILEDARANFWISSNRGIYRLSRQELNDFAAGGVKSITSVAYDKSDGMLSSECNGGYQPAGWKTRDGRLWFPTQGGVVVIDPETVRQSEPPPVHIEEVLLDQAPATFRDVLRVTPQQYNVEIHFTALSYSKPEQLQFKYKLAGFDDDWVDARTRRSAYYTKLPPGEYVFSVIASNSDGVWNLEGASIQVVVVPPFYRTWWFQSLAALIVAGVVLYIYQSRLRRLKQAKAAQEEFSRRLIESQEVERKRIAAELHDSLGQSLAIIKNRALFGLNAAVDADQTKKQFDEIASHSTQAIDDVKEIAYNLRPYLLDRLGLTKAIESMINKAAASSTIRISSEVDHIDELFTDEQEINFYRIIQESINNVIKHSEASEARVLIKKDITNLEITIQDNGKGFNPEATEANESRKGGFGLIGIAERARILGGKPVIDSAPGRGTAIKLKLRLEDAAKGDRR